MQLGQPKSMVKVTLVYSDVMKMLQGYEVKTLGIFWQKSELACGTAQITL